MDTQINPLGPETANCTCGQCIEGKMSKRMTFELLCTAEFYHDTLNETISRDWEMYKEDQASGGRPLGQLDYFYQLAYIPAEIRDPTALHKTSKVGFAKLIGYIAECLRKDKIPTVDAVMAEFSATGGKVEYALDLILDVAKAENYVHGCGDHWATFHEDIKKLAKCANDDNFDLISSLIFTPGVAGCTVVPQGADYPDDFFDGPISEETERAFREIEEFNNSLTEEQREEMRRIFRGTDEVP